MNARSALLQWLSKSELQRALDGLDLLCRHHADPQRGAEVALQSGRHHHLLEQQREGTIAQADYLTERARISKAVMDLVQNLPADWPAEPLAQLPSTPPPAAAVPTQKSFLEKWGLIIGIVAGIAGITGVTFRDVFFFRKKPTPPPRSSQRAWAKPPAPRNLLGRCLKKKRSSPTTAASRKTQPSGHPTTRLPAHRAKPQMPSRPPPPKRKSPGPRLLSLPKPLPPASFAAYAPTKIIEGMERGKVDGKHAFLNHQTREVLCCYEDAEDFSGGKAWVKQRGRYFHIDKTGKEVEE